MCVVPTMIIKFMLGAVLMSTLFVRLFRQTVEGNYGRVSILSSLTTLLSHMGYIQLSMIVYWMRIHNNASILVLHMSITPLFHY